LQFWSRRRHGPRVQRVADKISERGGEAGRIYLMGHSARAVHVASYVSHPEVKVKGGGLAGDLRADGWRAREAIEGRRTGMSADICIVLRLAHRVAEDTSLFEFNHAPDA
jgi:hypothetical protein